MNLFTMNLCLSKKIRFCFVLAIFFLLPGVYAQSQNSTVTGKVTDAGGTPLIGVSIMEQGTSNGTITDLDGNYVIKLSNEKSHLIFKYMGYTDQVVNPTGRTTIHISMAEDAVMLEETVVIAYGTKKRRDMIGSVAKIKSGEMVNMQGGRFENALQGRAAGVQVVNDGMPGSTPQIKIRGVGSIASGTDPLWVVDGMVSGGSSMVNFNDIESIEVLKDAAATAIYGSRGSNGVIIVTTKKGQQGIPKISLSYEAGITPITNTDLGLSSTERYFQIVDEGRSNRGLNPLNPQTDIINAFYSNAPTPITREEAMATDMDWVDLVTRLGNYHDVNLSLSQGGEHSTTFASVNYRSDKSSLEGVGQNAISARLNTEYKKGIVTFGMQSFLRYDRKDKSNKWGVVADKFPWRKVYDENDPTGYWNPQMADGHPTATLDPEYQKNTGEGFNFRANLFADINIKWVKGLSLRADASLAYGITQSDYWMSGMISNSGATDGNQGNKSKNTVKSQQYHFFGKYIREWQNHGIDVVSGIEMNRTYTDNSVVSGKNLGGSFQEPKVIGTMLGNNSAYIGGENYTLSFFNRIDYKFMNRYLVGASFVREGSSKFIKENRFGNFFSVSGGWIISDEEFMKNITAISMLKLRGSYGETGNQNIPYEVTQNAYKMKANKYYNGTSNMYIWNVANKKAKWEKAKSVDVGLDYSLWNGRVNGSFAYYRRTSDDMLLRVKLPASAGITIDGGTAENNSMWANVGSMYNQGFEMDLNIGIFQKKDFRWDTNFNLTTNSNKVTSLDPSVDAKGTGIINSRPGAITKKGLPIGTYFMAEWAGVDPQKGIGMIYEVDLDRYNETGETVKTGNMIPATRANVIKHRVIQEGKTALPKVYMGWTNSFAYKNIDLSFTLYLSLGSYTYNYHRYMKSFVGDGRTNLISEMYDKAWRNPGDIAEYPQLRWQDAYNYGDDGNEKLNVSYANAPEGHTRFLEKSSYLRLRDLTVGYNVPVKFCNKLGLNNFRLYASAVNLFTITSFNGYDPEIRLKNQTGANAQGAIFEGGEMPQTRIFSVGFKTSF